MEILDIMAIPLTKGLFALVDGEDYEELSRYKWHITNSGSSYYAVRSIGKHPKQKSVFMHRQIMNTPVGMENDHISRYVLDNRKRNLRFCTRAQNTQNRAPYKGKSSKYKGVAWHKGDKYKGKWQARIGCENKQIQIGCFEDEVEAAKAYDKKAKELFGEFAYLNFGEMK